MFIKFSISILNRASLPLPEREGKGIKKKKIAVLKGNKNIQATRDARDENIFISHNFFCRLLFICLAHFRKEKRKHRIMRLSF